MCVVTNAHLSFYPCADILCGKMVCGLLKRFSKVFSFRSGTRFVKIRKVIFKNLIFTHHFMIFVSFQINRTRLGTFSLEIVSYNRLYGSMS